MKKKPIIGISSSIMIDTKFFLGYEKSYVNYDYVKAVLKAGGIPIIIPFNECEEVTIELTKNLDGLILSGGHDVSPYNYGQEPHPKLGETFPERDKFDYILLRECKKLKVPILGICRGMQIINTYEGGTLFQDLSLINLANVLKHNQGSKPTLETHKVKIEKNTILYDIVQKEEMMVNSFHHQAVDKVANNYKVAAVASDGVVESIISEKDEFILAVQWHPEMLHAKSETANQIFKALVDKAGDYSAKRK
ncbi:gamma-glutamyl-gamma-aminobutyrate hydrolase family protein [Oceanivirga salmonicida]|uniref:gamma-glutamyl-gamma-aminobutyrate hydrolase family protein n=1 Tax=Oceanivirga salmonicida TaxID=1769291 RepID=UPI0012E18CD3|nr:gamma-glutamyl-gamma-aminobutyrate hydrolase family protein [Oceanivirga salmonicida]